MERLHQGPINHCFFGDHLNVECLEQGGSALDFSNGPSINTNSLRFEEQKQTSFLNPSLRDKIPFLQMLQSFESPPFPPFTEPNFQVLLRLQQQNRKMDTRIQAQELESCITHDTSETHSPVKSETKEPQYPHSSSCPKIVSSVYNQEPNSLENRRDRNSGLSTTWVQNQTRPKLMTQFPKPLPIAQERRKRKRTKLNKNRDEMENQRMTHIAVERNRRRQMNDHLNELRSLMPTSFIQRGDQASIIGGAIDLVKELEQMLQSLQAEKKMRMSKEKCDKPDALVPFNGFFTSPQYTTYSSLLSSSSSDFKYFVDDNTNYMGGVRRDEFNGNKSAVVADIEVSVIQTHVNLKILSSRRPGQLLKAIAALEDLRLTILHLNVTSLERSVLYSFNLKIEDECKLGSAEEIAKAVHQIFSYINGN